MKTDEDLCKVERSLKQIDNLDNLNLNLDKKSVTFSLNATKASNGLPGLEEIQNKIEKDTGILTVLKGN